MLEYLFVFIIAIIIFLVIDAIWLGLIANKLYKKELNILLKKNVNWIAAIIFYVIFIISLMFFVIIPGIKENSLINIVLFGSLFSFSLYATYDLTNYATIKGFPLKVVIIDLMWGTFLGTITATLTYLIYIGVF